MRRLRGGGCKARGTRQAAGGGRRATGSRRPAGHADCAHTVTHTHIHARTHTRARGNTRTPSSVPASPGHWRTRSRETQGRAGVPRMLMTRRLSHSSLDSRMLLACSFSLPDFKCLRPPPAALPSVASRLPSSFLEVSYSPGTLSEVAGLKINPVPISTLQGHLRPSSCGALRWLQQRAWEL